MDPRVRLFLFTQALLLLTCVACRDDRASSPAKPTATSQVVDTDDSAEDAEEKPTIGNSPEINRLMTEGKLALSRKRPQEARSAFNGVLFEVTDHEGAMLGIARSYKIEELPADAIEAYEEMLDAHSESFEGHFELAQLLQEEGRTLDALPHLKELSQRAPVNPDIVALYGTFLLEVDQLDDAIKVLEKARSLKPGHTGTLQNLANAYAKQDNHKRAIVIYKDILYRDPKQWEVRHNLGTAYLRNKQYKKAVVAWRETLKTKPDHAPTRKALASLEAYLNQ